MSESQKPKRRRRPKTPRTDNHPEPSPPQVETAKVACPRCKSSDTIYWNRKRPDLVGEHQWNGETYRLVRWNLRLCRECNNYFTEKIHQ